MQFLDPYDFPFTEQRRKHKIKINLNYCMNIPGFRGEY